MKQKPARGELWPYDGILPNLGKDVFLAPGVQIIGDVEIGENSNIWFNTVIRGDVNTIRIGKNTNIQDSSVVHVTRKDFPTSIGDNVTIGHMAMIHGCQIEGGAFIGMKATIMDGVIVESGAMVAAAAVVTPGKTVTSGFLWAGVPARPVRPLTPEEQETLPKTARNYVRLAAQYLKNS